MNPTLKTLLQSLKTLAPFPQVAMQVMKLGKNPDVTASDIVEVIQSDAGISAAVLREANSAMQGAQEPIGSIREAGNRLGTRRLMRLVMKAGARDCFNGLGDSTSRTSRSLWTESVTTACIARFLARQEKWIDVDFAYTVGLVQNIGHIVLDRHLGSERDKIKSRLGSVEAPDSDPDRALYIERDVLGVDHAELGAQLGQRWNFPHELVDAIRFHHDPEQSDENTTVCHLAHRAEELCWQILNARSSGAWPRRRVGSRARTARRTRLPCRS